MTDIVQCVLMFAFAALVATGVVEVEFYVPACVLRWLEPRDLPDTNTFYEESK